jgi:hypothetical protein
VSSSSGTNQLSGGWNQVLNARLYWIHDSAGQTVDTIEFDAPVRRGAATGSGRVRLNQHSFTHTGGELTNGVRVHPLALPARRQRVDSALGSAYSIPESRQLALLHRALPPGPGHRPRRVRVVGTADGARELAALRAQSTSERQLSATRIEFVTSSGQESIVSEFDVTIGAVVGTVLEDRSGRRVQTASEFGRTDGGWRLVSRRTTISRPGRVSVHYDESLGDRQTHERIRE